MMELAAIFMQGVGAANDDGQALFWARKAAELEDDEAQALLGLFYEHGRGVEKDVEEARRWYEKAARQGNANARAALGIAE